ncbi:helix-turn-helix transcriptional regulator [Arthrobacter sp. 35W]|uniref:helix-turn-helix transcriptional regulator n=1 Tax=Arthrobacter sp. 35W TaxID=1132441 RepID=UPI000411A31C|nr:YafY family protein [Arthrobacter sp. 35W]
MVETSARLLQLLSLLQIRREWTGQDLAARLEVTERTVRRDIGKLRTLGYPINASPGVAGGYQLGAGAALPPLLLDDNEAVAVALGLATMAVGPVAGIGEASVRALAKLEQVLPARLRPKFAALKTSISTIAGPASEVDPEALTALSTGIAARRVLEFDYQASDGAATRRFVEPYRLVDAGPRWYVVCWDLGRTDWRTFRVDRLTSIPRQRQRFVPRPLPAADLAGYVQQAITRSPYRYDLQVRIHAPLPVVAERLGSSTAQLSGDGGATVVRMGWDSLDDPLAELAAFGWDFEIVAPAALRDAARAMAQRLGHAAG